MNPDWYKIPIFASTPDHYMVMSQKYYPNGTNELDFELEFAVIIAGYANILKSNAERYIAGYTICNDWSARDLQRQEWA